MCTLSYVPVDYGFLISSNRDEIVERRSSPPVELDINGRKVVMPVDQISNGSWIAASSDFAVCLLNGGFAPHHKLDFPNATSRGKVIRSFFEMSCDSRFVETLNCSCFEPFTLVIFDQSISTEITELVWDGYHKHTRKLNPAVSHLWSSSTLYSEKIKSMRSKYFSDALKKCSQVDTKELYNLHLSTPFGLENGFRIKRSNGIQTISFSQVKISKHDCCFLFQDLTEAAVDPVTFELHGYQK